MIGLTITAPVSNASANASLDQSIHVGSQVKRSSRMLASTNVPPDAGSVLATSECHDLVGAHRHRSTSQHPFDQIFPPTRPAAHQARPMIVDLEVNLTAWLDPKPLADCPRNRHLAL